MDKIFLHGVVVWLTALLFMGCKAAQKDADQPELQAKTELSISTAWICRDSAFSQVESVAYDASMQSLYVSNGRGLSNDTSGYISRITPQGELMDPHWISNLHRPTGMVVAEGTLYVVDVDELLTYRVSDGKLQHRFVEPQPNCGLNDVAIDGQGNVYVSASHIAAVLKVDQDRLVLWRQDTLQLTWANGLAVDAEHLYVAGKYLSSITLDAGVVMAVETPDHLFDFDGIAVVSDDVFILTTVESSALWLFDMVAGVAPLLQDGDYCADLAFRGDQNQIWLARGNHTKKSYWVEHMTLVYR